MMENRESAGGKLFRGRRGGLLVAAIAVASFVIGGLVLSPGRKEMPRHEETVTQAATIWTCSMHPQIRLPEPGKCPICGMDLIPVVSGVDEGEGPRELRMTETARQLAQIQTTRAKRGFAEAEVRMVGKITYDETKLSYITAWAPGRLDRLFADYTGVVVNKGDHMVSLYSPELLAAQEELVQASRAVTALSDVSSRILRSTAEATLVAAREKLRLVGLTPGQIDRIERSGETSDHLTIYAPIGGVVVHKDATEGMYVQTGTRIYTIADLSKLWVVFEAYESDLPWLRFGQRVEFTSPSFPGEQFAATVSFIDPLVDPQTRTVRVRAVVENPGRKLKPDMFVRGVVKSRLAAGGNILDESLAGKWISPMHPEIVKDGPGTCDICGMPLVPMTSLGYVSAAAVDENAPILIPASAPLITGKRAVVYVEIPSDDGPRFEGREVELGPRAGDFYIVKAGVEEGELVVSNGAFKIDSELQIRAKPSMMSPAGELPGTGHRHEPPAESTPIPMADHAEHAEHLGTAEVRDALAPVYDGYFVIQMALARDDREAAASGARELVRSIESIHTANWGDEERAEWSEVSARLIRHASALDRSGDIGALRDSFYHLSDAIIELHEVFGHEGSGSFYLAHCPMARDGEGANWLQQEDVIWNSYFGEKMLRCGSIELELVPGAEGKQ